MFRRRRPSQPDQLSDGSRIGGLPDGVSVLNEELAELSNTDRSSVLDDLEGDDAKAHLAALSVSELIELVISDIATGNDLEDPETASYYNTRASAVGTLALLRQLQQPSPEQ